uniref:SLV.27 n=1 Tax=Streptomyces lavendulae TaxID=1914 RepID=Q6RGP3_STRLA|nr:SLV.27 [Streptomyces lavendulae]
MAFRKSISQSELAEGQSEADRERHATEYQPSRGGWFKAEARPEPGQDKDSSGGRRWGRR